MKSYKVTILGGGPSGLGLALGLVDAGLSDILILEKEPKLGGLSGSFQLDNYTLDYGPHRLSPEFPELVDRVREILGDDLLEVGNEHAVVFRDKVYSYPPKVGQFLNWKSAQFGMQSVSSFLYRRCKKTGGQNPSFAENIRNSFGDVLFEEVVSPLCQKVWGNPEELNPDFAQLRFSIPTFISWGKGILPGNKTRDTHFYYPKKGFQEIWDGIGNYLKQAGVTIKTNSTLVDITLRENKVRELSIKCDETQPTSSSTQWLVSTIPNTSLTRYFGWEEIPNPARFKNRGMILVIFLVNKESCLPARVVILPELKYSFNRLSEQTQFSPETAPRGKTAIEADILTEVGSPLWVMEDALLQEKLTEEVLSLGFFKKESLIATKVVRVPLAYPIPTKDRELAQFELEQKLDGIANLICTGRFASSDYNNSHSAMKRGMLGADYILGKLSKDEWKSRAAAIRMLPIRD